MKLSCCAYSFNELFQSGEMTLESFMDYCADINLDAVDLTQYFFPEETDAYIAHIKREALRRGLDISGAAIGGSLTSADDAEREKQIEHIEDWIVKAAKLGAPVLRVFAGERPEGAGHPAVERWVRDALRRCAKTAERHGVVLGIENHPGVTGDADGMLHLIDPLTGNPWVGFTLDFGNFVGADIYEQFARCAPHAVITHAKKSVHGGDVHPLVDYRKVVRIMRKAGFKGYMAIEYEETDDVKAGLDRFAAYLRGCIADA